MARASTAFEMGTEVEIVWYAAIVWHLPRHPSRVKRRGSVSSFDIGLDQDFLVAWHISNRRRFRKLIVLLLVLPSKIPKKG